MSSADEGLHQIVDVDNNEGKDPNDSPSTVEDSTKQNTYANKVTETNVTGADVVSTHNVDGNALVDEVQQEMYSGNLSTVPVTDGQTIRNWNPVSQGNSQNSHHAFSSGSTNPHSNHYHVIGNDGTSQHTTQWNQSNSTFHPASGYYSQTNHNQYDFYGHGRGRYPPSHFHPPLYPPQFAPPRLQPQSIQLAATGR